MRVHGRGQGEGGPWLLIARGRAYKELGNEAKAKADFLKAEGLKAKAKSKP